MTKKNQPGIKALIITGTSLALLIPVLMLAGLVKERQSLAEKVEGEITRGAGGELLVTGPFLGIPVSEQNGKAFESHMALVLPETLSIKGKADAEVRTRGIYSAPVFTSVFEVEAEYRLNKDSCENAFTGLTEADLSRARVYLEIPDPRALRAPLKVTLGDGRLLILESDSGAYKTSGAIMGARVSLREGNISLKFTLSVSGGSSILFYPIGSSNSFEITSNWKSPSFAGDVSPDYRDVRENGFTATWNLASGTRQWPAIWDGDNSSLRYQGDGALGVNLIDPVGVYHKSERALKYAILFIIIPFLVLFIFELFSSLKIHPIQYCLIGFADVVFYALLLSLGERLPWTAAYWISAVAVIALISLYAGSALKSLPKGAILLPVLGLLYFYLYSALQSEDWALLIGSLGVFAILAAVMFMTRNVNWYDIGGKKTEKSPPEPPSPHFMEVKADFGREEGQP